MSLPTDTRGEAAGSDFFKADPGQTKVLIVGPVSTGYQYWKEGESGAVRQREVFEEPLEGVRTRPVKDKTTGTKTQEPEKQQFFWALPVYNFKTSKFELWQITQKGIRDGLLKLQNNPEWGDPTGKYTITIDKTGESIKTKYSVTGNPPTDASKAEIAEVMSKFKGMDVDAILFGSATESGEEQEQAPVEEAPAPVAEEVPTPEATTTEQTPA